MLFDDQSYSTPPLFAHPLPEDEVEGLSFKTYKVEVKFSECWSLLSSLEVFVISIMYLYTTYLLNLKKNWFHIKYGYIYF